MKVELSADAVGEIAEAVVWYRDIGQSLAEAFVSELDIRMKWIERYPELPVVRKRGVRAVLLHRFPYFIFYRLRQGNIEVLSVYHTRRKPKYL